MTRRRGILGPIAAAWLVCQAATLTLAPALLWFGSTDAGLMECTCTHGVDATCPLHHRTTGSSSTASSRLCVVRSMTTSAAASLNALFGVAGLLPARSLAMFFVPAVSPALLECSIDSRRPLPPDPPPPRA